MQYCVVCKQLIKDKEEKDCMINLSGIPLLLCEECRRNHSNLRVSANAADRRKGIEWASNIASSNIFPDRIGRDFLRLCAEAEIFLRNMPVSYEGLKPTAADENKDKPGDNNKAEDKSGTQGGNKDTAEKKVKEAVRYKPAEDKALENIEYKATLNSYNRASAIASRTAAVRKLIISALLCVALVLGGMGYSVAKYLERERAPILPQLTVNNACTTVFGTQEALEECRQVFNNYYECFLLQDFSTASDYILFYGKKAKINKVNWKHSMKKQFTANVDYTKPVSFSVEDGVQNKNYNFYKFTVITHYTSLKDGSRIKTSTFVYGFIYKGCWYLAPNAKLLNNYINNNFIDAV